MVNQCIKINLHMIVIINVVLHWRWDGMHPDGYQVTYQPFFSPFLSIPT